MKLIGPLLALFLSSRAVAAPEVVAAELLRDDLRELARILEEGHPDPFLRGGGRVAFFRRLDTALRAIPDEGMSIPEFYRLARPIAASVQDGHTKLSPLRDVEPAPGLWIELEPVGRSLYVSGVYGRRDRALLGMRLTALAGVPVAELLLRMGRMKGYDNELHNLVHLAQAVRNGRDLADLIEAELGDELAVGLARPDGSEHVATLPLRTKSPGGLRHPDSRLELPEPNAADMAWTMLDDDTAYLRIDSMMRYREAFELWQATGYTGNLGSHLDRVARAAGADPLPDGVDARIAAVPSATELFAELFGAMQEAGTERLIVDLRRNEGGNSALSFIFGYFLVPVERLVELDDGYQVRRHSALYYDKHSNASPDELERWGLALGEYDFSREKRWHGRAEASAEDREAAVEGFERMASRLPTFHAELQAGTWSAAHTPEVLVVTSARTYSAGFDLARILYRLDGTLVGVPSSQAGNCFIDSLPFQLSNTGLNGSLSGKWSVAFPGDEERGLLLTPHVELTEAVFADLALDPNASVLLALQAR